MTPTLFDPIGPTTTRYACPRCPNRIGIAVPHEHPPTCAGAAPTHDPVTMRREEHRG